MKCDFCVKDFTHKDYLTGHTQSHWKPLKCDFCAKVFTHKHQGHKWSHTEENVFTYNYC